MVAGAAAQVALEALATWASVGSGISSSSDVAAMTMPGVQNPHCRPVLPEGLLHRVHLVLGRGQALDGGDAAPVGLDGQHGAGLHRLAVEVDRAGTARGGVATDVGAGEPEGLTDVVDEQRAWLDVVPRPSLPLTVIEISIPSPPFR